MMPPKRRLDLALTAEGRVALEPVDHWRTGIAYAEHDLVEFIGHVYCCRYSHRSGVFSADRFDGRWLWIAFARGFPVYPTRAPVIRFESFSIFT